MFPSKIKKAICLVMFLLVAQPQILRCVEDAPSNQDQIETKKNISKPEQDGSLLIASIVSTAIIIASIAACVAIRNNNDPLRHAPVCRILKKACSLDSNRRLMPSRATIFYKDTNNVNICSCERDVRPSIPQEQWFANFRCYDKKLCRDLGLEQ